MNANLETFSRIFWSTDNGCIMSAKVEGSEARIETSSGTYWARLSVDVTGRTLTKTCAGNYGTKAKIGLDGVVVSGWVS